MPQRTAFRVKGLDCAEEVAILKKEVGRLAGIEALDFDVLNAKMTVAFDAQVLSQQDIVDAVATTGMTAVPWEAPPGEAETFWAQHGRAVMTSLSAAFLLAGFLTHWAIHGSLVDAVLGGSSNPQHVFPLVSVLLFVAGAVAGAWHVVPPALTAARRARPDMNLLMVIAIIGAMGIGDWLEAGMVAFLFSVALLLEHWSVARARRAIASLMDISPTVARFADPHGDELIERPVEEVPMGAVVVVRPGEKFPLDGRVLTGTSSVNQAPITGESIPVAKKPGDEVYAGTINEEGTIRFEVTRPAGDTTLARIIHMVEESQSRRAPSERWVEKFARYYTPLMIALAVGIVVVPPLLMAAAWSTWLYRGLVLLVIACPCALVISTPVSVVSALTYAMRGGILVKGGAYLEAVGRLQAIALDKTGTLTTGRPEVQQVIPLDGHDPADLLYRAAAIEADSVHPLAEAILRRATDDGVEVRRAEDFRPLSGKGAEASIDGRRYWIGSHRLMHERDQETTDVHAQAEALEDAGHTMVAVGSEAHVCGLLSFADGLRPAATAAVKELKRLGIRHIVMLTGDNAQTARAVAEAAGVDEFRAELLPEEKVEAMRSLVDTYGQAAMVGDGVNDAPAMATASVGIAMGAIGSDAAIETADITLMSDDLSRVPWLIRLSRRTLGIIRQNVTFALGLKLLFIALACVGIASLWLAIAADTGASILVIFNGLRLLRSSEEPATARHGTRE